jgi:tryptophanase
MNYYLQTRTWKWVLLIIAVLFIFGYIFTVYTIIGKIAENERRQVHVWANTVQKKADMVNYTEQYFQKVREEELRNAEILAESFSYVAKNPLGNNNINFYFKIIESNENTPVILVDQDDNIIGGKNIDFNTDTVKKFAGVVKERFS